MEEARPRGGFSKPWKPLATRQLDLQRGPGLANFGWCDEQTAHGKWVAQAKGLPGRHSGQLCIGVRWPQEVTLRTHNCFENLSRTWFRGGEGGCVIQMSFLLSTSVACLGQFISADVGRVAVCIESLLHPPCFDPSSFGRMSRWPGSGVATKWKGAAVHWLWSTC